MGQPILAAASFQEAQTIKLKTRSTELSLQWTGQEACPTVYYTGQPILAAAGFQPASSSACARNFSLVRATERRRSQLRYSTERVARFRSASASL